MEFYRKYKDEHVSRWNCNLVLKSIPFILYRISGFKCPSGCDQVEFVKPNIKDLYHFVDFHSN